jgi:hypothetical protein
MSKGQWTVVGLLIVIAVIEASFSGQAQAFFTGKAGPLVQKSVSGGPFSYLTPEGQKMAFWVIGAALLVWFAQGFPQEATIFATLMLFFVLLNQGKPLTQGLTNFINTSLPKG